MTGIKMRTSSSLNRSNGLKGAALGTGLASASDSLSGAAAKDNSSACLKRCRCLAAIPPSTGEQLCLRAERPGL